jgi:UPF0755 protein
LHALIIMSRNEPRDPKVMRLVRRLILLLLLAAAGIVAAAWWWIDRPLPLAADRVELLIEAGTSPRAIAEQWAAAGVRASPELLWLWFRVSGRSPQIRAGSYLIERGATARQLLDRMARGESVFESVLVVEGWTFAQMREALAQAPALKPLTRGMSDAQVMAALGLPGVAAEGRFFPDTYRYSRGVTDLSVLRTALQAMQRRLEAAWGERAADLPLNSMDEALILASIVEKETGLGADRGMVASVFANRLRIGMPLQTDPTVIYGLGDRFDGRLHKRDLQADTPYNTYTRKGLPPTPIALPGAASLKASVHPAPSKALYFVARGDGASVFSDSLADHNRAVSQFQRGGR